MSSTPLHQAVTPLDHRIEAATGHSIEALWQHHERGLLDEPTSSVVDAHRGLAQAVTGVTFQRALLGRLASGEVEVDAALFARIDRTVDQLRNAAATRDACHADVINALAPVEQAARTHSTRAIPQLAPADVAALLAVSQGAKLHEHLLTQRLSVVTASGARVPYSEFQRLEKAGLLQRDESHPLHASQPVTVTDAGRATLTDSRRPVPSTSPPAPGAGSWPTARHHR
ncbi:hypothetical protein AN219_37435 [Streptomyces nanshensis]|nr:hypothetical protein AN219_37435 [Streptomyces nanshensis]